jgi:lipoprotein-anchoring transpeptidase ErfK/SrfK
VVRKLAPRVGIALVALAVAVTLYGTGDAFGPARGDVVKTEFNPATSAGTTGASASPSATPSAEPTTPAPTTPPATPSRTPSKRPATCAQGDKHRDAEVWLARIPGYGPITVDGQQSQADCATIKKFQARFGISPANGRAGSTTADVARRIAVSLTAAEQAKCGAAASGTTACIDLTLQTVWVVRDGAVVFGPTVTRTGFRGFATPAGTFKINRRNAREWSINYKVWLPYFQHFTSGMGFHETTTYLHNSSLGSHGCINLLRPDAQAVWNLLSIGTPVKSFGRRAGT